MTTTRLHLCAGALALGMAPALLAQSTESAAQIPWQSRIAIGISGGTLSPTANSQLFTLLGRALQPGRHMLQPRMLSGTVFYAMTPTVSLTWRSDVGGHTAESVSIAQPTTPAADLSQRTTLRIRLQSTIGAQFTAWRWAPAASDATGDRVRLTFGAGLGAAAYQLDQRGTFVDATRRVAYGASYRSASIGPMTYATTSLEIPVRPRFFVNAVVRQQWGSARMTQDYSTFDRFDLGGTTATLGLAYAPSRHGFLGSVTPR